MCCGNIIIHEKVSFLIVYCSSGRNKNPPALAVGSVKKLLSEDHQLSAVKLAEKIGVASRNIENNIKKLKEYGILIRHGSPKNGYWEIIDKDLQE